jgi:hypothetical protein
LCSYWSERLTLGREVILQQLIVEVEWAVDVCEEEHDFLGTTLRSDARRWLGQIGRDIRDCYGLSHWVPRVFDAGETVLAVRMGDGDGFHGSK